MAPRPDRAQAARAEAYMVSLEAQKKRHLESQTDKPIY